MKTNCLYYGDCLDWMRQWDKEQADLVYLDPPFNSNADYNILFGAQNGKPAQLRAFQDTWKWDVAAEERLRRLQNAKAHAAHRAVAGFAAVLGDSGLLAYLTYMAERLVEIRRILKPEGGVFLHCDPTASHYLKVLMDSVFGGGNFRNEIVWGYTGPGSPGMRQFNRKHDIILWYSKGKRWTFNADAVRMPHRDGGPHAGGFEGGERQPDDPHYGKLGKVPETWWTDIAIVARSRKENLKYPTQKPLKLLRRIISAASNKGDVVFDPFCGCGTTIAAARELGRQWAGVDISSFAIDLVRHRRLKDAKIPAEGIPADLSGARKLAKERPLDFEAWIISRVAGLAPNQKQSGDGGIDGRGTIVAEKESAQSNLVIAQVKGGKFSLSQFRDFLHVVGREDAAAGVYITLTANAASAAARAEAAKQGMFKIGASEYPKVQFWSVEEYFNGAKAQLPAMNDPYTGKPMQGDFFV